MPDAATSPTAPARSSLVVVMLLLVYVFNFVDRQILSILAAPIQAELHLTDAQIGLLGGIAFALLYSTLAVPLAWLADRTGRSRVIALALASWSAFTALCGLAQGFTQLFAARLGVGIGEAGGVAPSHALISQYVPTERRAAALAIYSLGIPLGSAAGILAGGAIAAAIDWRTAFLVVGLVGLAFSIPFKLLVRDLPATECAPSRTSFGQVARQLASRPSFWLLSLGAAAGSTVGYGLAFWMPSMLERSFGLSLVGTAHFIAALLLTGGIAGIIIGGLVGDMLGAGDRAFYAWVPALAYLGSVPLFAGGIGAPNLTLAFALLLVPTALSYVWLGPVTSAVQQLVAPEARATASALFLLINNLIGMGGGIYLLGALSTALTPHFHEEALRYAMYGSLGFYGLAALLMAAAGVALRKDWVDTA
jgi:predicted MFS family arabinose efflux permease